MDKRNSDIASSFTCWIYILEEGAKKEYKIGYTTNLPEQMRQISTCEVKLVYLYSFNNIIDALGHKLLLEQISTPSLRRIVRIHNPKLRDLREIIKDTTADSSADVSG